MKTFQILTIVLVSLIPLCSHAQRISMNGNRFQVEGKEIFMNEAKTPWNNWNDFGGNYNSAWWNAEFQRIKNAGSNSTRIWISCSGEVGLTISADGTVTGATSAFWYNLDDMFQPAQKNNNIYISRLWVKKQRFLQRDCPKEFILFRPLNPAR